MALNKLLLICCVLIAGCDQSQPLNKENQSTQTAATQSNGLIDHVITSMAGGAAAGAAGAAAHAAVSHGMQRWQEKRNINRATRFRSFRR